MSEITMKQWRYDEAIRRGVAPSTVSSDLSRGHYSGLKTRWVDGRSMMVDASAAVLKNHRTRLTGLAVNELPMKEWVAREAERLGKKPAAVIMRLARGKYPGLKIRRVNSRVVFVEIEPATA